MILLGSDARHVDHENTSQCIEIRIHVMVFATSPCTCIQAHAKQVPNLRHVKDPSLPTRLRDKRWLTVVIGLSTSRPFFCEAQPEKEYGTRCPGRLNDFLEGGQVRLDGARSLWHARFRSVGRILFLSRHAPGRHDWAQRGHVPRS